jgi:hypothetical protein
VALPAQRELRQCDYAWVEPSSGRVVLEGHRVVQAVAAVELDEGAGRSRSVQPDLGVLHQPGRAWVRRTRFSDSVGAR